MGRPGKSLAVGDVLQDRYRIEAVVGQGGFGQVYRARQLATGQAVAIKVMHAGESSLMQRDEGQARARFEREMRLIAELKHPNVVGLIDSGRVDDKRVFIALEYIDGITLGDLQLQVGGLSLRKTFRLMTQVSEAMAYAHNRGVVHRDLKPGNIMVTELGRRANAVVLDFGIAGLVEGRVDYESLTADGQLPGTPAYMAPEQFDVRNTLTPSADIYAWGLVFVEALLGRPAIDDVSVVKTMMWQLSEEKVPIPAPLHSTALGELLSKATAKPKHLRFQHADELLEALEEIDIRAPMYKDAGDALSRFSVAPTAELKIFTGDGNNIGMLTGALQRGPQTAFGPDDPDSGAFDLAEELGAPGQISLDGLVPSLDSASTRRAAATLPEGTMLPSADEFIETDATLQEDVSTLQAIASAHYDGTGPTLEHRDLASSAMAAAFDPTDKQQSLARKASEILAIAEPDGPTLEQTDLADQADEFVPTAKHDDLASTAIALGDTLGPENPTPAIADPRAHQTYQAPTHSMDGTATQSSPTRWLVIGGIGLLVLGGLIAIILFVPTDESPGESEPANEPAQDVQAEELCKRGQIASDQTKGHCCWPGQVWHDEKARCFGPPDSCPSGFTAQSEDCVPVDVQNPDKGWALTGPGRVTIREITPATSTILINGRPAGRGAGTYEKVPMGEAVVVVRAPDHRDEVVSVVIADGALEVAVGSITLEPNERETPVGMVYVPEGPFWMGCDVASTDCEPQEHPGHEVELSAYFIDRTEVSVAEYKLCASQGVCTPAAEDYAGAPKGACHNSRDGYDAFPINCVNYAQATTYCEWAGKRLPTEAEWEKAARGQGGSRYPWGIEEADCSRAIMIDKSERLGCGKGSPGHVWSRPRGASPYGLLNMAGNVKEWVSDWYDEETYKKHDGPDPMGVELGTERVARGGAFDDIAFEVRVSLRDAEGPDEIDHNQGFRCAKSDPAD